MVVCVLIPRFALVAALRARRDLLGEPVALGPEPGGPAIVGEVAPAAEAFGVTPGMRMGEALARCPSLQLVPPDPEAVTWLWGDALDRLEGIGAAMESDCPGEGYFEADGLLGIHDGRVEAVMAAARRALSEGGVSGVRVAASTCRFSARVAALERGRRRRAARGRPSPPPLVGEREVVRFLAPQPVALLRARPELGELPGVLEMLGIRTLGELAALPSHALSERFGHPGLLALDLAQGRDTAIAPRRPAEAVRERLGLPEAASGPQLEHALELLLARLLARPERRGRSLRGLAVSARFVEGGGWRRSVTLRQASADPERLRLAIVPRLSELPAPAESLGLEVEAFGPPARHQPSLGEMGEEARAAERRERMGEAVQQARRGGGEAAALRVIELAPGSRLPERRAVLAPYPAEGESR